MIQKPYLASYLVAALLTAPVVAFSQGTSPKRTLIINGQSTQVPVIQVNGQSFVGLEALADAVHGSLSYAGSMVALSVPMGSANSALPATPSATSSPPSAQGPSSNLGFSRGFLNAGIEQMSTLREWHTALATAIQNGIPITAGLLAPYRAQATTNLRLAQVAATTPSDRSAYQLLSNEFQNMGTLSDKYIKKRADLSYIAPDALQKDDLNQRIIACGHSLGAMAASGQFVDDGSCN
jgi:hypothetical protein